MSDQPNTQRVRERLSKLFEFFKAYTDLRFPPVRDIAQQPRSLWLKDLPSHPSVELFRDFGKSEEEIEGSDRKTAKSSTLPHGRTTEPSLRLGISHNEWKYLPE
jgi:hypothetical protein